MVLLFFVSGNPLFSSKNIYLVSFLFSMILFFIRGKKFDKQFSLFTIVLFVVFIFQTYIFGNFPAVSIFGVFIRISIAYFIFKSLDTRFVSVYINTIYYISILSLFIFVLLNLLPPIHNLLLNVSIKAETGNNGTRYSLVFYTLIRGTSLFYRNSGPFWEPGAFGGYLILGLIFNYIKTSNFFNRKGIVLLIALLSTASTTAFIALFVFLYFLVLKFKINKIYKFIMLILVVFISFYLYTNVAFIGEKISSQIESAESSSIYTNTNSQRFLSALRDFQDIKGYYLWGRGPLLKNRYSIWSTSDIRTNGLTDYWVRFGSLFLIFSSVYLFSSFKRLCCYYNSGFAIAAITLILIVLQSETYFNFPLFLGLFFLGSVYKCDKSKNRLSKHVLANSSTID